MENDEEEPKKGFTVTDRRIAKRATEKSGGEEESYEAKESQPERQPEPEEPLPEQAPEPEEPRSDASPESSTEEGQLSKPDFAGFVLSLANTAMLNLGVIPNPMGGDTEVNIEGARQMIDILEILDEKTRGNLTEEEDHLLKQILAELRMQFVGVAGKS